MPCSGFRERRKLVVVLESHCTGKKSLTSRKMWTVLWKTIQDNNHFPRFAHYPNSNYSALQIMIIFQIYIHVSTFTGFRIAVISKLVMFCDGRVNIKPFDETAVFGSACRHGFPKQFLNLKHGER